MIYMCFRCICMRFDRFLCQLICMRFPMSSLPDSCGVLHGALAKPGPGQRDRIDTPAPVLGNYCFNIFVVLPATNKLLVLRFFALTVLPVFPHTSRNFAAHVSLKLHTIHTNLAVPQLDDANRDDPKWPSLDPLE